MIKTTTKELILRKKIIKLALLQERKLYVHGMHGPQTFDCAGFVWYVYFNTLNINIYEDGIGLSTTTKVMTSTYGNITYFKENDLDKDLSKIYIGDVLFFHRQSKEDNKPKEDNKYPGHCGIYLGNNKFIHVPRNKGYVTINDFESSKYWTKKLVASKDIISKL